MAQQVVPCRVHHTLLLGSPDARARAAKGPAAAAAHLHKYHGAVALPHDEVNLATPTPRRPIIALEQLQSLPLQKGQSPVFCRISTLAGGGSSRTRRRCSVRRSGLSSKEFH